MKQNNNIQPTKHTTKLCEEALGRWTAALSFVWGGGWERVGSKWGWRWQSGSEGAQINYIKLVTFLPLSSSTTDSGQALCTPPTMETATTTVQVQV